LIKAVDHYCKLFASVGRRSRTLEM